MEQDFFASTLPTKRPWHRRSVATYFDWLFDRRIAARMRKIRRDAARLPTRRVLVAAVEVPGRESELRKVFSALCKSRHDVTTRAAPMGQRGKFDNINHALAHVDLAAYDWLIVTDDDVDLPESFLDDFLFVAEAMDLKVAQPAHRCLSWTSFIFNYRKWNSLGRVTRYVECGPVTAFHRDIIPSLVPFPPLRWAWGIDITWPVIAERHGMQIGIVDATPIEHLKQVGSTYGSAPAIAEAREFLAREGVKGRAEDFLVDIRVMKTLQPRRVQLLTDAAG